MNRIALFLALVFPFVASAQDGRGEATALEQLVASYEQAVRSGDVSKTGIRKSLTDDFSAALPSGQLIRSYGELTKAENALRTMVGRGAVYDEVKVSVDAPPAISGDLAVLSGQTANHATAQAGKSRSFKTYWTAVARRVDGQWRLARHQAVMDPANNPWNAGESSGGPGWMGLLLTALIVGGIGVAAGLVLARILGSLRAGGPPVDAGRMPATAAKPRAWDTPASTSATVPDPTPPAADPPPATPTRKRPWEK